MDPLYTIELFGGLRVVAHFDNAGESSGRAFTRFRTHQTGSLLAYLAISAGRMRSREVLIDMFWPDADVKSGRSRLSMALSSLRGQLEPPGIAAGSILLANQHSIGVSHLVTTDTAEFERLVDGAERLDAANPRRKNLLLKAMRIYDYKFMPGYYDPWTVTEQERLGERARTSLIFLAKVAEREGDLEAAMAHARRAASGGSGDSEEAELILERVIAAASRLVLSKHAPLSAAASASKRDREWKQARPSDSPEAATSGSSELPTTEAKLSVRVEPEPAPAMPLPTLPVPLTRFFGREAEFAALASALGNPQCRLITLTGPGGSGKTRLAREAALRWRGQQSASVTNAIESDDWRPPEVISLDFSTETDPFRIPVRVGAAIDLAPSDVDPFENTRENAALAGFVRAFSAKHNPILVLDNIEQLLPRGADWIESLLQRVPTLKCVATSRMRLRIAGEHEIAVSPLGVPSLSPARSKTISTSLDLSLLESDSSKSNLRPESLLRDWPSVALFVDRAQAARPDFALTTGNAADVIAIVRYLEGLPLSIELAAARAQVMTPSQMLKHLPDKRFDFLTSRGSAASGRRKRAGRHSSLRETIDWSVSLLPEEAQTFYAQMSVFRGGWEEEAAEAVTDNPLALDVLAVLSDASLIRSDIVPSNHDEVMRFTMLESLREFAATLLNSTISDTTTADSPTIHPAYMAAARRHAYFFADMVARCAPHLQSSDSAFYLDELGRENENIRAAITWAIGQSDGEITLAALVLAGDLGPYWYKSGRVHEGRSLLRSVLARRVRQSFRSTPSDIVAPRLALAVNSLSMLAMQQGDLGDAKRWVRIALFLDRNPPAVGKSLRMRGAPSAHSQYLRRRASMLNNFALIKTKLCDPSGALRSYEESLRIWRQVGEIRHVGTVLSNMGTIACDFGHWDEATERFSEAITIARASNNPHGEAVALNNLGEVAYRRGMPIEALTYYRHSLRIFQTLKDVGNCAKVLFQTAVTSLQLETGVERAARVLQYAWTVLNECGIAISEKDKAAAIQLAGQSWMTPLNDTGDHHATLDSFVSAVLTENRFASAAAPVSRPVTLPALDRLSL